MQFVFYGDACAGVPDGPHEAAHRRVNEVVARLSPVPEFVVFPGDEIVGLVSDEAALRAQWRHWLDVEMAWLDRSATPLFNATGNHTTYDAMSARVFCEALAHLPRNGAPGQEGLSYARRWGELLMVFVHTLAAERGGEGHVEADWLRCTLEAHADARWRLVVGHHPAFPVNGYVGPHQRTICAEDAGPFWRALVDHGVTAYLCSHILAFDVQCHGSVLQITSAGAGTVHRMPEGVEYLHCVQMALDGGGLRLQVIDDEGRVRERLDWPPPEPGPMHPLGPNDPSPWADLATSQPIVLAFSGRAAPAGTAARQTLLCGADEDGSTPLWIGLTGPAQRLAVLLQPEAGRSPHLWLGPGVEAGAPFDLHLMLHPGMGPGGLLWRPAGQERWTSLDGASAWGSGGSPGPSGTASARPRRATCPSRGAPSPSAGAAAVTVRSNWRPRTCLRPSANHPIHQAVVLRGWRTARREAI